MPFNQFMTLPVEVFLLKTPSGYQIAYRPTKELENIRSANIAMHNGLDKFVEESQSSNCNSFDLSLTFKPDVNPIRFSIKGVQIAWDPTDNRLECLDRSAIAPLNAKGELNIRIIVDTASIEIFANRGLAYIPIGKLLDSTAPPVVFHSATRLLVSSVNLHSIQSVW
jgi:sucrose-6-phosphate hydrolase SacC (GH32 family)